jgi:hypothetical protein
MCSKTIVEYLVLSSHYASGITDQVRENIKAGWQPLGPVQHSLTISPQSSTRESYVQTMVKYATEKPGTYQ